MKIFLLLLSLISLSFSFDSVNSSLLIGYKLDGKEYLSMGIFVKEGVVITSSNFFSSKNLTKDITLYVNDTDKNPPICFAKLRVKAVDEDRNLALLEATSYLDVFCNNMGAPTNYHREFMKSNGIELFCKGCDLYPPIATKLEYVLFEKGEYLLKSKALTLGYFYRSDGDREYVVGFSVDKKPKFPGTPYFGKDGMFYGLFTYGKYSSIGFDGVVSKGVVSAFICELQNSGIIEWDEPLCEAYKQSGLFSIIEEFHRIYP